MPSIFPSIRVFSNELALPIRWPKYCSFSFSISPSNEYSGFIFYRIDWFDLLIVQGILKSLLQHHSLKASVLRGSAFFMVQLSLSYKTTGKTIALTIWTSVSKMMSLLFNTLPIVNTGFLSGSAGKESAYQCRRCKRGRLDPWVGKIPWSRNPQPTSVFLPEKSLGQRSLVGRK